MAISNGYATLTELKTRLGISDSTDDTPLEDVIEAASRQIDKWTGRVFYATTATRYFTAEWTDLLFVDDLLSVTTLKTDENDDRTYERTWSATDYDLEPYNETPYVRIRTAPAGLYAFPTGRKAVEIAGSWGYCATGSHPEDIREACLLMAARFFKRKDAPFGVAGNADIGELRTLPMDPDVKRLLAGYKRLAVGGV